MSEIAFKINNTVFDKWESIQVQKSMEQICGSFGIITTDFFPDDAKKWNIKTGDECTVEINNKKIITGYIDAIIVEYDENEYFLRIQGRDKTLDLVDCSYVGSVNEWKNQTIRNIITNLCSPFSIAVKVDSSVNNLVNTRIETFKADEGDYVADLLIRLCTDHGIFPMCLGDGALTLTKASTVISTDTIELGVNAKRGMFVSDNTNRYSNYTVKGQGIGTNAKQLSDFISPSFSVEDEVIKRYRPLIIFADTPTDIAATAKKAKWENRIRAGKSRSRKYVLENWSQTNNEPWQINTQVRVKDEILKTDSTFLISDINYYFDTEEGEITNILVIDPTSYDIDSTKKIKTDFDK